MSGKDSGNGLKGFEFRKPLNESKWEHFRKTIYDSSTQQFLGRTGKSWGQLLLFYSLFYIVLGALLAICMQVMLSTLDDKEPKWKLDDSLIGTNPGLGFRPISPETEEGSLIWYDINNRTTSDKWIKILNDTLAPYLMDQTGENFEVCDFDKPPSNGHVCTVDLDEFGPCSPENNFGYYSSSPCIFLKLNKIFDWVPEFYTTPQDQMTQDLKEKLINETSQNMERIWISCKGQHKIDEQNLHDNNFEYIPSAGFASYYFPYKNVDNYLSPLVAVRVMNLTPNVIVSVECRAWAKNILYRGGDLQREGSIHFELLIDQRLEKNEEPKTNESQ